MPTKKKYLIIIGGPTASGKTSFAIQLAQHFQTEIISCDSRQFYQETNIGTAKPSAQELQQIRHHFIDSLSIFQPYSVGQFEKDALQLLQQLFQKQDILIAVGGSGLYIKALCEGLDEFPKVPNHIRTQIETDYQKQGIEILQQELQKVDPEYYKLVDTNNPARLIRALAVFRSSGRPMSEFRTQKKVERFFQPIYLQLYRPRAELYTRINQRVDKMVAQGLVQEAKDLLPNQGLTALQTVGYQELFECFNQKTTLEEAIELIKRNSRRYAKRQLTWARRDGFWKQFRPTEKELALAYINAILQEGLQIAIAKPTNPLAINAPFGSPITLNNTNSKWLFVWLNKKLLYGIQLIFLSKAILIIASPPSPISLPGQCINLLFHEAVLLSDGQPLFAIIPLELELFLASSGFERVLFEQAPEKIKKHWTNLELQICLKLIKSGI